MISGADNFTFKPADFYPFKNLAEIERVRAITKEDIVAMNGVHPKNPNMKLEVIRNDEFEMIMLTDMVKRIIDSDRLDQKCVMIMCNPCPTYRKVAYMLRQLNVNCRNVKFYMMDEWADEDGNIYISSLNQVQKWSPDHQLLWELKASETGLPIKNMTGLHLLPNGHLIIGCYGYGKGVGAFEVTPEKKILWTYRSGEPCNDSHMAVQLLSDEICTPNR